MMEATILLLVYYTHQEDRDHAVLRHVIGEYCPAYLPFDVYLRQPLRRLFSRVVVYDFLRRRAEIGLEALNREILDIVDREQPRYVLWTSFYDDVQASTLDAIRERGPRVIGWFFDDEWRFESYSRHWAPHLDCCVTNAAEAVPRYRALNAPVIQTIPNTGVAIDRSRDGTPEKYEVSFVGSMRIADRRQCLARLRDAGAPLTLFGDGSGGYISFEEMVDVFGASKINLNFSKTGPSGSRRQIKGRVFQACLAGGFMLTEYAPGIEDYFAIGREIVCFEDVDEMVDKVRYYLTHDAERRAIARAGRTRATAEHTSDRMVARVFREIERDVAGRSSGGNGRSDPAGRQMPLRARAIPAEYHFQWGRALLEESRGRKMWGESLAMSLSYSPLYLPAWYYWAVGLLPHHLRSVPLGAYGGAVTLGKRLVAWSRRTPLLNGILQRLFRAIE